jgi:hypothetical protein
VNNKGKIKINPATARITKKSSAIRNKTLPVARKKITTVQHH